MEPSQTTAWREPSERDELDRAIAAIIAPLVQPLERAHVLARQLALEVTIDRTKDPRGTGQIELMIQRGPDGTIYATGVRIAHNTEDVELFGHKGVHARCTQYNDRIRRLHELADWISEIVHEAKAPPPIGSPLAYAYQQLMQIGDLIAARQMMTMRCGAISLATLTREVDWFSRCDSHMRTIVAAVEHPAAFLDSAARSDSPSARPRLVKRLVKRARLLLLAVDGGKRLRNAQGSMSAARRPVSPTIDIDQEGRRRE